MFRLSEQVLEAVQVDPFETDLGKKLEKGLTRVLRIV